MNSALMMTERKSPSLNGSAGAQNGVVNALRRLYDPVLEEPVPDFLLRAASMTPEEAAAAVAARDAEGSEETKPETQQH